MSDSEADETPSSPVVERKIQKEIGKSDKKPTGDLNEEVVNCFLHPRVINELRNCFHWSKSIAEYLADLAQNISVKPVTINMYMDSNENLTGEFYFTTHPSDAPGIRELFNSFVLLTSLPKPGSLI